MALYVLPAQCPLLIQNLATLTQLDPYPLFHIPYPYPLSPSLCPRSPVPYSLSPVIFLLSPIPCPLLSVRPKAVDASIRAGLWGLALLIAAQCPTLSAPVEGNEGGHAPPPQPTYQRVVRLYANTFLRLGTPLHTMALAFSGQAGAAIKHGGKSLGGGGGGGARTGDGTAPAGQGGFEESWMATAAAIVSNKVLHACTWAFFRLGREEVGEPLPLLFQLQLLFKRKIFRVCVQSSLKFAATEGFLFRFACLWASGNEPRLSLKKTAANYYVMLTENTPPSARRKTTTETFVYGSMYPLPLPASPPPCPGILYHSPPASSTPQSL